MDGHVSILDRRSCSSKQSEADHPMVYLFKSWMRSREPFAKDSGGLSRSPCLSFFKSGSQAKQEIRLQKTT